MIIFLSRVTKIDHNLKWKDVEKFCKESNYKITTSKKGYKVYIGNSIWSVHLEHRASNELKHGIIRELRKILIKENVIINNKN